MKAYNEPAISLFVYFKSVKKRKYVLRKSNNNNNKRAKIKKFPMARVEPQTSNVEGQSIIYCTTTTNNEEFLLN